MNWWLRSALLGVVVGIGCTVISRFVSDPWVFAIASTALSFVVFLVAGRFFPEGRRNA